MLHIAKVLIVVDAPDWASAADIFSDMLSGNSVVKNWSYVPEGAGNYPGPKLTRPEYKITPKSDMDDDLMAEYDAAVDVRPSELVRP